ncbi:MAG: class I SAM-dependent methyltransferase [Planctomycetota bacterium]|jgi:SAM-dependent methyltransferase
MSESGSRQRTTRILDLGCGTAKVDSAIGVDIISLPGVDAIVDASRFPYPFSDNSFDEIYMLDIIEHLPNTVSVMEEIYRIARPSARVVIRVANWNHRYAVMDPTHVGFFTENSFDFFGERTGRSYYSHARFSVERVDYIFDGRVARLLRSRYIMKLLSNYLCNILQGLKFELRALK